MGQLWGNLQRHLRHPKRSRAVDPRACRRAVPRSSSRGTCRRVADTIRGRATHVRQSGLFAISVPRLPIWRQISSRPIACQINSAARQRSLTDREGVGREMDPCQGQRHGGLYLHESPEVAPRVALAFKNGNVFPPHRPRLPGFSFLSDTGEARGPEFVCAHSGGRSLGVIDRRQDRQGYMSFLRQGVGNRARRRFDAAR